MNVLSLFDGIACTHVALERADIDVTNYFSSEVDSHAMAVAQKNFPSTTPIGGVEGVLGSTLPDIDLLVAGSPCQGFSLIGKQLNFSDPRSRLILEFFRIRDETNPKYFLLENVRMNSQSRDYISKRLGVEPVVLNSALVSAQNRQRLYWTNIPHPIISDRKLLASQFPLDAGFKPATVRKGSPRVVVPPVGDKFGCLTASYYKGINGDGRPACASIFGPYLDSDVKMLSPEQCEMLQTLRPGYTAGAPKTQRYKMLGNAFTVDIIVEFLKSMVAEEDCF